MRTIAEVLRWRAQRHPDLPAIKYEGQETSYGDLNRKTDWLALGLIQDLGLRDGDRVAILDKNCSDYLELLFALDKAGVVAAPINWRLTPVEVNQILADIQPRLLVVGEEFRSHGKSAGVKTLSFEELPRINGDDPGRDKDGAVFWQFATSGTTGLPKGAMLTGHNVLNVGLCLALEMPELREGGPSLVCMPMFHLGGAGWAVWAMQEGATLTIVREIQPSSLLKTIVEEKIETALLVPAVMLFLTELPEVLQADFSNFRHVVYGTAPIAPDLLQRCIEIFDCRFTQIYGLTETAGPFAALPFEHHRGDKLLSCGRPMFGGRAKIVDENGRDLPPGEIGEIVYQGENLMTGYWNRPEATAEAILDGWFHTGDAGIVDQDGFFYVKDRIKDMIVTGSENVYPAEVEASLSAHPDIVEIAVIGVPDDRWGEMIKAIAVRRQGSELTESELIEWTKDRLAGYKRPRSVDFLEALPRNASGKVLKRTLREPFWKGRDRAIN